MQEKAASPTLHDSQFTSTRAGPQYHDNGLVTPGICRLVVHLLLTKRLKSSTYIQESNTYRISVSESGHVIQWLCCTSEPLTVQADVSSKLGREGHSWCCLFSKSVNRGWFFEGALGSSDKWKHTLIRAVGFPGGTSGKEVKVAQSCLTLSEPVDYTVRGILQARILE